MATDLAHPAPPIRPATDPGPKSETHHRGLLLLIAASAVLMVSWAFVVPIFESPDEIAHWQYAQYVRQNHALPPYNERFEEGISPPLYYILIAPLASPDPGPPPAFQYSENYTKLFLPFPPRYFKNAPGDLHRYWSIRAARLFTVLISLLTVYFCYLAGTESTGKSSTGLLVGGLVAFLPQFTFRGMNVSSDALLAMCSAAATYLIIRMMRRGFAWRDGVLGALAMAAAILTKESAIFFPAPFALAMWYDKARSRTKLVRLAVLGALTLVIVCPWLIHNQHAHGDLLLRHTMRQTLGDLLHVKPLWSRYFIIDFPKYLTASFIGDFGYFNVPLPVWAYILYFLFLALAALSWLRAVVRGQIDRRLSAVLLTIIVLNLMVVIDLNLSFDQPQGRYMFPALAAIAVLLGLGFESLPFWSKRRSQFAIAGWALANLLILVFRVGPAYWPARR
jgi:4-amino-4-deoxy-L-arabinose transferase-like glycosyltransferase